MTSVNIRKKSISVTDVFDVLEDFFAHQGLLPDDSSFTLTNTHGDYTIKVYGYTSDFGGTSIPRVSSYKIFKNGKLQADGNISGDSYRMHQISMDEGYYLEGSDNQAAEDHLLRYGPTIDFRKLGDKDNVISTDGVFGDNATLAWDGRDTFYMGDGDDVADAGAKSDQVYGGDGHDKLFGNSGHDKLYGEAGRDKLFGEVGDDKLYGGNSNDRLDGGRGNDSLEGGGGFDKFYYRANYGKDKIVDFDSSKDALLISRDLKGGNTNKHKFLKAFGESVAGDFVLDFGHGNTLTILDATKSEVKDALEFI